MRLRWAALLLVLAACSSPLTVSTATTPATAVPPPSTSTTQGPKVVEVGVGVIWEVESLTDLGFTTSAWARSLYDVEVLGDRLIVVGRDGGDGLALISDDQGITWRRAAVEGIGGAESSVLAAVSAWDGILVAVGEGRSGCPDPSTICDRSLGAVWRSTDNGESWSVVEAPSLARKPSSFIVDVAATAAGFVAIGDVDGPSPHSALLWTSPDGLIWSEGIALPPTEGGFTRADRLVASGSRALVAGGEVLCGEWYDNGFWVIAAGFARQARLWEFDGKTVVPVRLAEIGMTETALPDCSSDELLAGAGEFSSTVGPVGLVEGAPAVFVPGAGVAIQQSSGGFTLEGLDLAGDEHVLFVDPGALVVGVGPGPRGMIAVKSWRRVGEWVAQPVGLPVVGISAGSLASLVSVGDSLVGVGAATAGATDGLIWRSRPGELIEGAGHTCEPAPAADCRGVDLSEADLAGMDLAGIDLRNADLGGANLSGSDLTGARLTSADLYDVDLSGAVLRDADLAGVTLSSLTEAIDITGADFTGADLRGARIDLTASAVFDAIRADAASFTVSGEVVGVSFREASLVGTFFTTDYDASEAALRGSFDGADLERAYIDLDVAGSTFDGVDVGEINFGTVGVCPDGSSPIDEAYGIRRCSS